MAAPKLTAVLGPTNTGKTHLAVTRMCGHASGMMGFPLRLLAREVYDRVVAIKGRAQVALVTGEEKIVPDGARYWLCTAEAMPTDIHPEFIAIDEVQLAADPERGHVFTDRLLHRRGTAETMLLGASTMIPMVRRLLPDAFIESRPRFSQITHAGPKKLSRLPRRAALIAFSVEEVYALAEMLRRQKGGAAVVMGALSPRTRNAQVDLYQSGEVDYLVATDAIGMGLNMDIDHIAFAALSKFDGQRNRRLSPAEMAQIAGRAGRYQTDGTFGTLVYGDAGGPELQEPEVEAIESHDFTPVKRLTWRNARLDWRSLPSLIQSLEQRPERDDLARTNRATDEAVLKLLAEDPVIAGRAGSPERLRILWSVCNLPDYRKSGAKEHARLAARIFLNLTEGDGHIPTDWIAAEVARLDDRQGGIDALSHRISAARTWTYISHREAWLANPRLWADRTRALEEKLSDALHERLRQRFVDRRTSVLMRDLAGGADMLPLEIDGDGTVAIGGEEIGTLTGFRFTAETAAKAGEKKRLIAAAERRLSGELAKRGAELIAAPDHEFELALTGKLPPRILWRGARVARIHGGPTALRPRIRLARAIGALDAGLTVRMAEKLSSWLSARIEHHLAPLALLAKTADSQNASPAARGLAVQMIEALGVLEKRPLAPLLASMTGEDRALLSKAGVTIGITHLFVSGLLRPAPTRWRLALWAIASGLEKMPQPPAPGIVSFAADPAAPDAFYPVAGFTVIGGRAIRLDMIERLSRALHTQRKGMKPFMPDENWVPTLGLDAADFGKVMRALGYRRTEIDGRRAFLWRGLDRPVRDRRGERAPSPHSPFAALKALKV
ncbi:helicase-related protein [Pacificimonas pallii]|nr:helicase-related protein [Pacificimonas pallii]